MPHAELAIVAALEEELAAVRAAIPKRDRAAALLVCCGVGWDAATRAAAKLLDAPEPPRLICSTGFCGGLTDLTAVGDIVLASVTPLTRRRLNRIRCGRRWPARDFAATPEPLSRCESR
ncbi:MAG: hypothetical protein NTW87_31465 [Planctomycetota bacterium]|nr:hypothetical protein [Planctomycetota bacterium]